MNVIEYPIDLKNMKESDIYLWRMKNVDFIAITNTLKIKSIHKIHLNFLLCHKVLISLVRPILDVDINFLNIKFINGYRKGD